MSLVGNLEDLSLGDILQIISLSRKSGVLALESDQGSGRVIFASGLVRGARVKGGTGDLRDLLVGSRVLDSAAFDAATERAIDQGVELAEALASLDGLDEEKIESLIKDAVEAAIFEMFSWTSGDFSFDVRSESEPDDPELLLPIGVNAQYLAMEGLRLRDESERDAGLNELGGDPDAVTAPQLDTGDLDELDPEAMFGDEPLETDDASIGNLLDGVPFEVDAGATAIDEELDAVDIIAASGIDDELEDEDASEDSTALEVDDSLEVGEPLAIDDESEVDAALERVEALGQVELPEQYQPPEPPAQADVPELADSAEESEAFEQVDSAEAVDVLEQADSAEDAEALEPADSSEEVDALEEPDPAEDAEALEPADPAEPAEELEPSGVAEQVEAPPIVEESEPVDEPPVRSEPPAVAAAPSVESVESATGVSAEMAAKASKTPVILIEPDVAVLDWVKSAIQSDFARVHVFQQAEQGLSRIRQYLIRGELPLVLISPDAPIDPLSGIHGLGDFVKRLKTQSAKLVILGLREDDDAAPGAMPSALDGVLRRPAARSLRERSREDDAASAHVLAVALQEVLHQHSEAGWSRDTPKDAAQDSQASALRDMSAKLQQASSRGEILPLVLDFSKELFERVAVLIVRDDEIFAIAGRGIENLEVDPLDPKPQISLPAVQEGCVRQVIASSQPLAMEPSTAADRELIGRLGDVVPDRSYYGPIESGGEVVALLYGDQAEQQAAWPDTSGLEVVLHQAGLALDRAALGRALWEADPQDH